jgi:magnesium-transporting ATPase (P-type)
LEQDGKVDIGRKMNQQPNILGGENNPTITNEQNQGRNSNDSELSKKKIIKRIIISAILFILSVVFTSLLYVHINSPYCEGSCDTGETIGALLLLVIMLGFSVFSLVPLILSFFSERSKKIYNVWLTFTIIQLGGVAYMLFIQLMNFVNNKIR